MAQIIREITLDVAQANNLRAITAKQNDLNSRFLKIHITDEGNPILVSLDSKVIMNVKRTDNQVRPFYGSVNDDGSVTVPLTPWMLDIEGSINCDVSIVATKDNQKLTTLQFSIYVEAAVFPQNVLEESDEYDVFSILLEAAEHTQECVDATKAAKEATKEAEDAASGVTLVEQNKKGPLKFWVGTKEEYDALSHHASDCFYIISDDTDLSEINRKISEVTNSLNNACTPYDISAAITPTDSYSNYNLIKYGKLLVLNYELRSEGEYNATNGESIITLESNRIICTIEGYVPVCTSYCTFNHYNNQYTYENNVTCNICIEPDSEGKNTIVRMRNRANMVYSHRETTGSQDLLTGYFTAVFTCR